MPTKTKETEITTTHTLDIDDIESILTTHFNSDAEANAFVHWKIVRNNIEYCEVVVTITYEEKEEN